MSKIGKTFDLIVELLTSILLEHFLKDDIFDILGRFDEEIILKLLCILDSITADDLFCKHDMEELIFNSS